MAYASLSDISGNRSALKKGGQDFWVVKTDDLGGIIWDASYGSDGDDVLFGMECLSDGTIILAGTSIGANISFDKTEPPFSSSDAWVIAIDEDGNKLWDKTIGGSGVESSGGLIVIEDTIYLAVSSTSGISGLRNEPLKGNKDVWLTKLDKSGNIINMNFYGGDNSETVLGLSSIQNNTVLIHTRSNSDSSIDKSENSRGILDTWLIAIDTEGNIIGDKTVGGNEVDLHSKLINFQSNLLLGGISLSDVSGDKTIPKFNSDPSFFDVWLVELDATILDVIQTIDITPSVYPNPVNDFLTINLSEFSSVSKVDVYDYQGKLLLSRDLSNTPNPTTLQIDMSAFSSGMYTIRVYGDNVVRAVKVVK